MNTESPRLRALMAAGAALVVFGITIPATASTDAPNPNRPGVGEVGQAQFKADPKGQSKTNPDGDTNNGFRCDDNNGAGKGNPALGLCPVKTDGDETNTSVDPDPNPPTTGTGDPNSPTTGGGDTTTGDGDVEWSADGS